MVYPNSLAAVKSLKPIRLLPSPGPTSRATLRLYPGSNPFNHSTGPGMAPTFCNRCGDAVEEGCDPKDELAELDALLEPMKLKRYDLKRKINRLHSPIVRQLPPDVMSTIFEFCLPDFADYQFRKSSAYYTEEDLSIPLSLGAICSYWREIAWSTSSLWSSMVLHIPSKHDSHIVTGIAKEWLARSGGRPLSIRISSRSKHKTLSRLANIINEYSTRWSDLDLDMPDCYFQRFHATDNHAPKLKSIRFYCSAKYGDNTIKLNLQPLNCPRLERACLSFFPMDGTDIQWDNLTHLTLNSMFINDSLLILRKTPRLVFCKVTGDWLGYRRQNVEPVLTSLRSLQLLSPTSAYGFLNSIIAPRLEELHFPECSSYYPALGVSSSFFRRSACSLRSFSMAFPKFPPNFERFMHFFGSMDTLSIISITETASYSKNTAPEKDYDLRNILQLVAKVLSSQSTSPSPQQCFFPNLKIVKYTGKLRLPAGKLDDLYSLPPANNAVHCPLHLFKLDIHPITRIPKKLISYFSGLVERGVTVKVLSKSEDIFQSSIDYYRRREESLCRDWADNLDSSLFS